MTFQTTDTHCPVIVDGEQVGVASRVYVDDPVGQVVEKKSPFTAALIDKVQVGDTIRTAVQGGGGRFEVDVCIPAQKRADTIEIKTPADDSFNQDWTVFVFEDVQIEPWEMEVNNTTVSGTIGVGSWYTDYRNE